MSPEINKQTFKVPNYIQVKTLGAFGGRPYALIYALLILAVTHLLIGIFLVHVAHMKGRKQRHY